MHERGGGDEGGVVRISADGMQLGCPVGNDGINGHEGALKLGQQEILIPSLQPACKISVSFGDLQDASADLNQSDHADENGHFSRALVPVAEQCIPLRSLAQLGNGDGIQQKTRTHGKAKGLPGSSLRGVRGKS